ncbi:MAG: Mor transcription activator family protein [Neptuniibacter sp.]
MLEVSLQDLICSPLREVLQDNQFWPTAVSDVADSIDFTLSDNPEIAVIGRAALTQVCFTWGGCNFYLPDQKKLMKFIDEHHLYHLGLTDPEQYKAELSTKGLDSNSIEHSMQEQHFLHTSNQPETVLPDSQAWKAEVSEIIKQLHQTLSELDLTFTQARNVTSAVFTAMSFMRGGQTLFVPTCKSLEAELRKKLVYRQFNGKNARQLARKYHISLQHVYRLIKAESCTRKSPI